MYFRDPKLCSIETYGKCKQSQPSNTQNVQLFHQSRCLAGLYLFAFSSESFASPVHKVHQNSLYESVKWVDSWKQFEMYTRWLLGGLLICFNIDKFCPAVNVWTRNSMRTLAKIMEQLCGYRPTCYSAPVV